MYKKQGSYGSNSRPPARFHNTKRNNSRSHNRGPVGENISHARFINKATITEEVEHFASKRQDHRERVALGERLEVPKARTILQIIFK